MSTTNTAPAQRQAKGGKLNWSIVLGGFAVGTIVGGAFLWSTGHSAAEPAANASSQPAGNDATHSAPAPLQVTPNDEHAAQLQREVDGLKQELEAERLRNEVARLRGELSAVRRGSDGDRANEQRSQPRRSTSQKPETSPAGQSSAGELTLSYWNSLNEIIVREASMRSAPLGGLTAANAADFLSRRGDAGRYASSAIRKLDSTGVDREVVTLAGKLAAWYDDNSAAAGNGGNLLGADAESRQGQAGKHYQADERALQQNVTALNREGEQVRAKMSRKYGLQFPKLQ